MKNVATAIKQAIHSPEVKTFFLYEIHYDPPNDPVRWTSWSQEVAHNGYTYAPAVIKHGAITWSDDGKVNPVTMSVGNIAEDRYIQQLVENYDMVGKQVTVIQLFEGIDDPLQIDFVIKGAKAKKGQVDFQLSIGFDFLLAEVPCRTIYQKFCRWTRFKEDGCQYNGPDTECGMTWDDCVAKGNTINFGGAPGILNSRFVF